LGILALPGQGVKQEMSTSRTHPVGIDRADPEQPKAAA